MSKILVIDDNAALRDNISSILEYEGYAVIQAANGKEGLECVRESVPDLIICDIMMPVMDGFNAIKEIKANPDTASVPVIILSAREQKEQIIEGLEIAEEYITKPFDLEELSARVASLMRLKRAQDEVKEFNRELEKKVALRTRDLNERNYELSMEVERRRRSEEEVVFLSRKLLDVREDERTRIAAELHDDVGQKLMALKWQIQGALDVIPEWEGRREVLGLIGEIADRIRDLSQNLSPVALKSLGLPAAIEKLSEIYNVNEFLQVSTDLAELDGFFPENWDINVYRIIQESLVNILKHSRANQVVIECRFQDDGTDPEESSRGCAPLLLSIRDDGCGFNPGEEKGQGLGLLVMKQRAGLLEAKFWIISEKGRGTEIKIEFQGNKIPLKR